MIITAISQNKNFNPQAFQQNQKVTSVDQLPPADKVSFGVRLSWEGKKQLRKILEAEKQAEALAKEFFDSYHSSNGEILYNFLVKLRAVPEGIQKRMCDFKMENQSNRLRCTNLRGQSRINPRGVTNMEIDDEIKSTPSFIGIAATIAKHPDLNQLETLRFLMKNNFNGSLSKLIEIVNEHAQQCHS